MEEIQQPNALTQANAPARACAVNADEVVCPICFDVLSFPVTLPCGHNFDRGCLLSAWEHGIKPKNGDDNDENDDDAEQAAPLKHAMCPLCRQCSGIREMQQIQVNRLLRKFISDAYPCETQAAATEDKEMVTFSIESHVTTSGRQPFSLRTASSVLYVYLASITDPPGFVLAVLLLLGLVMIAYSPSQMFSTSSSNLPMLFSGLDALVTACTACIHQVSLVFEELWPWLQLFSIVF